MTLPAESEPSEALRSMQFDARRRPRDCPVHTARARSDAGGPRVRSGGAQGVLAGGQSPEDPASGLRLRQRPAGPPAPGRRVRGGGRRRRTREPGDHGRAAVAARRREDGRQHRAAADADRGQARAARDSRCRRHRHAVGHAAGAPPGTDLDSRRAEAGHRQRPGRTDSQREAAASRPALRCAARAHRKRRGSRFAAFRGRVPPAGGRRGGPCGERSKHGSTSRCPQDDRRGRRPEADDRRHPRPGQEPAGLPARCLRAVPPDRRHGSGRPRGRRRPMQRADCPSGARSGRQAAGAQSDRGRLHVGAR